MEYVDRQQHGHDPLPELLVEELDQDLHICSQHDIRVLLLEGSSQELEANLLTVVQDPISSDGLNLDWESQEPRIV